VQKGGHQHELPAVHCRAASTSTVPQRTQLLTVAAGVGRELVDSRPVIILQHMLHHTSTPLTQP
jgi:hypothetical protein